MRCWARFASSGINATLEQAERAIEVRGIHSQQVVEALGRLRGEVEQLTLDDVRNVRARMHELDMSSAARWEIRASVNEDVADFTQHAACAAPPEPTQSDKLDLGWLRRSPPDGNALAALTRALDVIEASATVEEDRRRVSRAVLESIAHDWSGIGTALVEPALEQMDRLEQLHFDSLMRMYRRCMHHDPRKPWKSHRRNITSSDILGLVKVHTVVDTLAVAAGGGPVDQPWAATILGVGTDANSALSDSVTGVAGWRSALLTMRHHWAARIAAHGLHDRADRKLAPSAGVQQRRSAAHLTELQKLCSRDGAGGSPDGEGRCCGAIGLGAPTGNQYLEYNDFDLFYVTAFASLVSTHTAATVPYRVVYAAPLDASH